MACRHSLGLALFIRCIIGLTESASFPAVYHFFPLWVPIEEKTFMIPFIGSGMYMGEIIGFSLSGVLVGTDIRLGDYYYGGWQSVFYIFGLAGILWFPFWVFRVYESPDAHPYMSKEEVLLIKKGKIFTTVKDLKHETDPFDSTNPLQSHVENNATVTVKSHKGKAVSIENNEDSCFEESLLGTDITPVLHATNEINFANDTHHHTPGENRQRSRIISVVSDANDDYSDRIPYYHFFTHPVALTLFINSWTFVSFFLKLSSHVYTNVGYFLYHRDSSDLRYYLKCLPFSLMS